MTTLAARTALLTVLAVLVTAAPAGAEPTWRDLLRLAEDANRGRSFEGRLVVVSFEPAPAIGVVRVAQDEEGRVVTDGADAWMFGRVGGEVFLGDSAAGTLLRIGAAERGGFSLDRLAGKYRVAVTGWEAGIVGTVAVVTVQERGTGALRERLHIDESSGVVVRRETFDAGGEPVRLAAFTQLELAPTDLPAVDDGLREFAADRLEVGAASVGILRDTGWVVPEELPGGFELTDAAAIGEGERSTLHLTYSDGLYDVSIYQQHGRLDGDALADSGARRMRIGPARVWRWPGAQPVTVVWGGHDMTFTAVTDAPPDALGTVLAALPHEEPPSVLTRLRRGLARVARWAWPFG